MAENLPGLAERVLEILGELPCRGAMLDEHGVVVVAHEPPDPATFPPVLGGQALVLGGKYLAALAGGGSDDTEAAARCLRRVLSGEVPTAHHDYMAPPAGPPLRLVAASLPGGRALVLHARLGTLDEVSALEGSPSLRAALEHERVARALRDTEQRYRLVIGSLPLVVYSARMQPPHDGTWISENAERISGFPAECFLRRPGFWRSRVHPDDVPVVDRTDAALEQHGCAVTEYRWQHADGTWHWFLDQAVLTRDETGEPREIAGTWLDITDRKEVEEAVRESENRLALVLGATQEGVWDWRIDTGEVYFSEAWVTSLGYEPEEVPPHISFWHGIVHPDDMSRTKATLQEHLEGRTPYYECENRLRQKDGTWRWNLDRGRVIEWDPDGRPLRMVGTDADVTARKLAEAELAASQERALGAERLAAVGTLAAGIAHELNNPIGAILLAASFGLEAADGGGAADQMRGCLCDIEREARRCRGIVESVLLFAREGETDRREVSLESVVEQAVSEVQREATALGARIDVALPPDVPLLHVNPVSIEQVVVNLLRNALESGERVRVTVTAEVTGGEVRLHVRDTGRGISPEERSRLFDPFYSTRRDKGGTGLGLSISHGIVRRHGGTISVESTPRSGSTFTVTLPLCRGEEDSNGHDPGGR